MILDSLRNYHVGAYGNSWTLGEPALRPGLPGVGADHLRPASYPYGDPNLPLQDLAFAAEGDDRLQLAADSRMATHAGRDTQEQRPYTDARSAGEVRPPVCSRGL